LTAKSSGSNSRGPRWGAVYGGVPLPSGLNFEFQVKMQRFMHFRAKNYTCGQKPGPRGGA